MLAWTRRAKPMPGQHSTTASPSGCRLVSVPSLCNLISPPQLLQLCPGATSCAGVAGSRTGTTGEARQSCRDGAAGALPWGTQPGGTLPELGSQGQVRMGPQPPVLTVMLELWVRNVSACRDRVVPSPQTFLWGAPSPQHPSSASSPWEAPSQPGVTVPRPSGCPEHCVSVLQEKIRFAFLFPVWNGNK